MTRSEALTVGWKGNVKMASSPKVVPQSSMDFYEALRIVSQGGHVTRLDWDDRDTFLLMRGGFLCISQDGKLARLLVSDGDIYATDWVIASDTASVIN